MYFITEKKSKTGKSFQTISDKKDDVFKKQKQVAKEIGFHQWRGGYWTVWGGFSCLMFKDKPNEKVYKKQEDGWMPKLNSKEGKEIQAKLDTCPKVEIDELNKCIGFDGAPFKTIGFGWNNKKYFGFSVEQNWKVKIPKDCKEITTTEYKKLFPSK